MLLLLACTGEEPTGGDDTGTRAWRTPEEVLADAAEGDVVTVRGDVFTVTFDSEAVAMNDDPDDDDGGGFDLLEDRWALVRTEKPDDVSLPDLDYDAVDEAWALGVHFPPQLRATLDLPRIGDAIEVTGTFTRGDWNGGTRAMLDDVDGYTVIEGAAPRGATGDACALDLDCGDQLVCDRETSTCQATPEPIEWGSAWHDVNGACDTDADCPLGQWCDPAYTMVEGEYAPPHGPDDLGRHLCVPTDTALEANCPTIDTVSDLAGGRYTQGKEVCVEGTVLLDAAANDGDTHVQLVVDEPIPYPVADMHYAVFGATTENVPPYKDPSRPQGAIDDPSTGTRVVVLGTYRFDEGHGWFEVHPVKGYWTAP